jgi:hypothetical protein
MAYLVGWKWMSVYMVAIDRARLGRREMPVERREGIF